MIAARGVHHVAVLVRDLAAVERFYRETLGLALLRRWPKVGEGAEAGDRSAWLDTGDGGFLAIELAAETTTESPDGHGDRGAGPGLHLVALRIEAADRAAWEQRLARAGVAIDSRTDFTLYVRDPEGNRVGLSHYPERAPGGERAELR